MASGEGQGSPTNKRHGLSGRSLPEGPHENPKVFRFYCAVPGPSPDVQLTMRVDLSPRESGER
jgi:hypothetical protein